MPAQAVDLTKPALTDSYTAFQSEIVIAVQTLAAWLDPNYATPSSQPVGTKRFNPTTGLLEMWSGSAWATLPSNYLQLTATALQSIAGAVTIGGAFTVSSGGLTVTGTSNITGTLGISGTVTGASFNATSTRRLKENIRHASEDLVRKLDALQAVQFTWTQEGPRPGQEDWGFIAEDVAAVLPELVAHDESGRVSGVDYGRLTALLLAEIQSLRRRVEQLERQA